MAVFLVRFLVFALPLAALFGLLEARLGAIPNSYNTRREVLERRLDTVEILITGSSHANHAIRPSRLTPPTFSLANAAQDLYYDAALVEKYLPRMPRLRLVIVTVSYHSFEFRLCRGLEPWRCGFYTKVWDVPRPAPRWGLGTDQLNARLGDLSYVALYGTREVRRFVGAGFDVDLSRDFDETGWHVTAWDAREEISEASARRRLARHHAMISPEHVADNVAAVRSLLGALRARGGRAVLVTTPVYRTYSELLAPGRYRRMQALVERLAADYDVEYHNYLTDPRFTVEDFLDNDHLNGRGAATFTAIIARDFVGRLLERGGARAAR
jgi:hypothetical protein